VPYPDYREATAKTLEYAYNDFCVMQVAEALGKKEEAEEFKERAFSYRNVFNTATGFMQGKDINGKWIESFDPNEWGGPFTEGNAWHYSWSVFHDVQGLIGLMGGKEEFIQRLDSVFIAPNTVKTGTYGFMIHEMAEMVNAGMGQYAHGNQPIQHMIYLYNYAGQPWKTQQWTRFVMDSLYSAGPDGYCGDEDNGQTSAWYIFSALGFYPVTPGFPAYVAGSPLFEKATLILPSGKEFIIKANNNSPENKYVREVKLNGETWTDMSIPHEMMVKGGILEWEMQDIPDKKRGTDPSTYPFSLSGIKE
jgi:predicted alpha-1,2-mannosidase